MPREDRELRGGISHDEARRLSVDHARLSGDGSYAPAPVIGTIGLPYEGALLAMKRGARLARAGWNGRQMWVHLHRPVSHPKRLPYLELRTAQGELIPWTCSQADALAEDWVIAG